MRVIKKGAIVSARGNITNGIRVLSDGKAVIVMDPFSRNARKNRRKEKAIIGAMKVLSSEAKIIAITQESLSILEKRVLKADTIKISQDYRKVGRDLYGAISRASEKG